MIATTHIAGMLDEAARLARLVAGADDPMALMPDPEHETLAVTPVVLLERAANLAAHAAAELEDERLRARHGFPIV